MIILHHFNPYSLFRHEKRGSEKKRAYAKVDAAKLEDAITWLKEDTDRSMSEAERLFGVNRNTIRNHLASDKIIVRQPGRPRMLTDDPEKRLADYVKERASRNMGDGDKQESYPSKGLQHSQNYW